MSRKLVKSDLLEILTGATYLAGGGGGSLYLGVRILDNLEKQGPVELTLYDVSEMEAGAYGAMAACLGSPKSITAPDVNFSDTISAFKGLQADMKREGKDLKYVYSGEFGGLNTCVAMYISIVNGTPLIDFDSNARAVPELNTGLAPIYGFPPYPVVLANEAADVCVVRTADPEDSSGAENIARQLCQAYGMKIGFSTWAISKEDILKYFVPGTLSLCQKVGKAIIGAKNSGTDPIKALESVIEMREITRGKIDKVDLSVRDGFDFGIITLTGDDGQYTVHFKNENMAVFNPKGEIVITVPETIALINLDNKEPLTTADVEEGMTLSIAAIPAQAPWWKIPEGFTCWVNILEKMGIPPVPVKY